MPGVFTGFRGRKYIKYHDEHGNLHTKSHARHLMEQHLGYQLEDGLEVDHIDDDCTNDNIDNLQVLTNVENRQKEAKRRNPDFSTPYTFNCPVCNVSVTKNVGFIKDAWDRGCDGPFCDRSCRSKYINHPERYPEGKRKVDRF